MNHVNHIEELQIARFRGLRDLQLPKLAQINLIVGGNNTGKTSLLEAISVFCRPLDPWAWIRTASMREFKFSNIPILESVKWLFPRFETTNPNDLLTGEAAASLQGACAIREVQASFNEFITDISLLEEDEEEFFTGELRRGIDLELHATTTDPQQAEPQRFSETFQLWEHETFIQHRTSACPALTVHLVTPYTHQIEQLQLDKLSEQAMHELDEALLPLLHAFDPQIQGFTIMSQAGFRRKCYIKHKHLGTAPLSCFSDGVRRVMLLATMLQFSKNGLLLLDELDTAIQPDLLATTFQWVVRACVAHQIQLFATTHSLETCRALVQHHETEAAIAPILLERQAGETRATRLEG